MKRPPGTAAVNANSMTAADRLNFVTTESFFSCSSEKKKTNLSLVHSDLAESSSRSEVLVMSRSEKKLGKTR